MKPTDAERDPAFDRLIARGLAKGTDASGVACPDADLLAAWFDHSLSPAEAERIEAHISSCGTCQQVLGDLARSEPEVTRAAPLPAPARPWHWHWRWLVPLATAAIVVVIAGRTLIAPEPAVGPGRLGPPQPESTVAELREKAVADAAPVRRTEEESRRSMPAAPAPSAAAAQAPAGRQDRSAATADRVAEAIPLRAVLPSKPAESKAEAQPVGGVVGGAVGGVAKGRVEGMAENMAAAAPVPAAPQMAVARTAASARSDSAGALQSTSAPGPSGTMATWRYGPGGVIERSTDRGQTWERQQSGVTATLVDGSATTDRVCWIVGERGVVLRTVDGRTWQRLPSPTAVDLVSVHAWGEASATITAADRSEFETMDGGRSWRQREPVYSVALKTSDR